MQIFLSHVDLCFIAYHFVLQWGILSLFHYVFKSLQCYVLFEITCGIFGYFC